MGRQVSALVRKDSRSAGIAPWGSACWRSADRCGPAYQVGFGDFQALASAAICDRRSSGRWPVSTMDSNDGERGANSVTSAWLSFLRYVMESRPTGPFPHASE